jgi:hypothetical protein
MAGHCFSPLTLCGGGDFYKRWPRWGGYRKEMMGSF